MVEHGVRNDSPGDEGPVPTVPDHDLIRPIGKGGFGQVWLATNRATGHLRAVKLISLHHSGQTDPASREVTSIARLEENVRAHHANLLPIHHVGRTVDHLFYVMDVADDVSGSRASSDSEYQPATLQTRLKNGALPPEKCLRYARQLLRGLAALHQAGMVRRDVKPANCLFVDGELKLADFGLLAAATPHVSRVGTRSYMPPDGQMDTRADVFAAGLVIYEMVTGLPVGAFPRLGERTRDVSRSPVLAVLNRLVLRACERDPQRRFPDAEVMLTELTKPVPPIICRGHASGAERSSRWRVPLPCFAWRQSQCGSLAPGRHTLRQVLMSISSRSLLRRRSILTACNCSIGTGNPIERRVPLMICRRGSITSCSSTRNEAVWTPVSLTSWTRAKSRSLGILMR